MIKRPLLAALVAALFILHALFYVQALGGDAVDDAYISFRYARNAMLGQGLMFNPGERVEGFTNFLWTGLMIPVVGSGLDVGRVSMALGVLFGLGLIWLAVRLARELELPPAAGWLAAIFLAVDGSVAIWAVSGLETALFAFLIGAGALFYLREQKETKSHFKIGLSCRASAARRVGHPAEGGDILVSANQDLSTPPPGRTGGSGRDDRLSPSGRPAVEVTGILEKSSRLVPPSGILFALAAMTRPEAAAVFALTAAHQAAWRLAVERRLFIRSDLARVAAFAGLFLPYWLVRWRYYHSFFPNSFYAKVAPGGPAAQLERGWNYVSQFVGLHLSWLILLPALLVVVLALYQLIRSRSTTRVVPPGRALGAGYLGLVIVAYGAYIVYVGGDWSVGRFFVPVLAPAYVLIAAGFVEAYTLVRHRLPAWVSLAAAAVVVAALGVSSSWNGEYGIFVKGFDAGRATAARETMGRWLKANAAPGTWIAVDAAGQVPYFSGLAAIDMFGINDLHIGRLNVPTLGTGTPGHEKFDLAYIIQRAPRYVIIYGNLFDSVTEYRRLDVPWTTDAGLRQFLTIYERKE